MSRAARDAVPGEAQVQTLLQPPVLGLVPPPLKAQPRHPQPRYRRGEAHLRLRHQRPRTPRGLNCNSRLNWSILEEAGPEV